MIKSATPARSIDGCYCNISSNAAHISKRYACDVNYIKFFVVAAALYLYNFALYFKQSLKNRQMWQQITTELLLVHAAQTVIPKASIVTPSDYDSLLTGRIVEGCELLLIIA